MNHTLEELHEKMPEFHDKFKDPELDDFLSKLAGKLQDADNVYHHLGYLFMNVRSTVAHSVRPKHLQHAMERAERSLKHWEEEDAAHHQH